MKLNIEKLLPGLLQASGEAAIAAYPFIGKNQNMDSDFAATAALRRSLNLLDIKGKIAIGEGERDKAPMLYRGEKLGTGHGESIDIAVDPLEGTDLLARGEFGAMSVIAIAGEDKIISAPDIYMEKLVTNIGSIDEGSFAKKISINNDICTNLDIIATAKSVSVADLKVTILDRCRHKNLIHQVVESGAKLNLIKDGDIAAVIDVALGNADMYIGIGGSPEGVLAASAVNAMGGEFFSRFKPLDAEQKLRLSQAGIADDQKIYTGFDLVNSESVFVASGITDGPLVSGIKENDIGYVVQSLVITNQKYYIHNQIFSSGNTDLSV